MNPSVRRRDRGRPNRQPSPAAPTLTATARQCRPDGGGTTWRSRARAIGPSTVSKVMSRAAIADRHACLDGDLAARRTFALSTLWLSRHSISGPTVSPLISAFDQRSRCSGYAQHQQVRGPARGPRSGPGRRGCAHPSAARARPAVRATPAGTRTAAPPDSTPGLRGSHRRARPTGAGGDLTLVAGDVPIKAEDPGRTGIRRSRPCCATRSPACPPPPAHRPRGRLPRAQGRPDPARRGLVCRRPQALR